MSELPNVDFRFNRDGKPSIESLGQVPYLLLRVTGKDLITVDGGGMGSGVDVEIIKEFVQFATAVFEIMDLSFDEVYKKAKERDEQES